MEILENTEDVEQEVGAPGTDPLDWGVTHFILSYSYIMFLFAVILGVVFDTFIPTKLFDIPIFEYLGIAFLVIGPVIIYWAQSTSGRTKKKMEESVETATEKTERDFEAGPYKYSRSPTHIGLTILTLGFAILINSLFSVIFLIVASLLSKFVFLRKEEEVLEVRYGEPYRDYKKKVSTWV